MRKLTTHTIKLIEINLAWLSLTFFIAGVLWAFYSPNVARYANNFMESFIDGYSSFAPFVIYFVLTPSLIKLFSIKGNGKRFAIHVLLWFSGARLVACFYAVLVTSVVFGLPLYSGSGSFILAITEATQSLGQMLLQSPYFYAVYAAILTVLITLRLPKIANFLGKGVDAIEFVGQGLIIIIPLMMLGVGAYMTVLPDILISELSNDIDIEQLKTISMLGFELDISTASGMITLYVLASLLTGLTCGIWHAGLMAWAIKKMPSFSVKAYFKDYWVKVYPMLWATSSEALSTPLNLHMVNKFCPNMYTEVRQFVVGVGSFMNINGTVINVFIMIGVVGGILNLDLSALHLLLCIPVIFLIAYGIPGIPGELIIFSAPIALSLGVSPELMPMFLALYVSMQIGLPDSFRTAANSTDECLSAIILNDVYVVQRDKVSATKQNIVASSCSS
jgi:hypothetical protein